MTVNYHILNDSIIINYAGKVIKVPRSSTKGEAVIDLIRNDQLDEIPMLIDNELRIRQYCGEKFILDNGVVYSYGEPVHPVITDKILQFYNNNLPFDYLLNFWNNLKQNPNEESIKYLYDFLVAGEFPLTPDGYFIAYKRITSDFLDLYTRTIDNSIGAKPSMSREQVDNNRSRTCSCGLHVAAFEYAKYKYGNTDPDTLIVEVKVNPKDVVMVPYDYDNQKGRVCEYEVIGVIDSKHDVIVLDDEKYADPSFKVEPSDAPINVSHKFTLENESTDTEFNKDLKIGNDMYSSYPIQDDIESRTKTGGYSRRKPSKVPSILQRVFYDLEYVCNQLYTRDDAIIGKVYLAEYTNGKTNIWVTFKKK